MGMAVSRKAILNRMLAMSVMVFLLSAPQSSRGGSMSCLGWWEPISRSHASINGAMEVRDKSILWKKHGAVEFTVIKARRDVLIIELARAVDCGTYVRLGPL